MLNCYTLFTLVTLLNSANILTVIYDNYKKYFPINQSHCCHFYAVSLFNGEDA